MKSISFGIQVVRLLRWKRPIRAPVINTDPEKGVDGSYKLVSEIIGAGTKQLQPKEELVFYAAITGYKNGEAELKPDVEKELQERKELIAGFWDNLILETPDPVVNTMFAFAKIRGAESIYDNQRRIDARSWR